MLYNIACSTYFSSDYVFHAVHIEMMHSESYLLTYQVNNDLIVSSYLTLTREKSMFSFEQGSLNNEIAEEIRQNYQSQECTGFTVEERVNLRKNCFPSFVSLIPSKS